MQAVQHVKSNPLESHVLSLAMPILICPACDAGVKLKDSGLLCRDCGQTYLRNSSNGVIYFVEEESYAESFGLQWKTFSREQLDNDRLHDSERRLRGETGLFPEQIAGKIVLDAGCGMGRFLDIVSRDGAALAVYVAGAASLSGRRSALIIKGDIFRLPFRRGSFDAVFSVGVLHHTPSTEQAFRALVPMVKPGGEIAISVYAATVKPGVGWALNMFRRRFCRVFTRRRPKPLMLWWSLYCVPVLWVIDKIPLVRWIRYLFPAAIYANYPLRWSVLDTFDTYATELESRHRPKEVFRWFREAGLINVDLLDSEDG